jgi:hypothetical protein
VKKIANAYTILVGTPEEYIILVRTSWKVVLMDCPLGLRLWAVLNMSEVVATPN